MWVVARGAIHDLLIVEDNLNLRETLRDVLATETTRVRVASTLTEARAALAIGGDAPSIARLEVLSALGKAAACMAIANRSDSVNGVQANSS